MWLALRSYRPGPAILVTAAFIGPGTILAASKAGAEYGFALLWAVVFSVVTAIVLQEMASRLGIVSENGLAEALRRTFANPMLKWSAIGLVLAAILFGNTAYQTGNIVGAVDGINILTGINKTVAAIVIAAIAIIVVLIGRYSILQWSLTVLVGTMGIVFVVSAVACWPNANEILNGLRPTIPGDSAWVVIGLIGTTVVPYNLFLHASASAQHFIERRKERIEGEKPGSEEPANVEDRPAPVSASNKSAAIVSSFLDTLIAIAVGGIITASLLITAASTFEPGELTTMQSIAEQLRPTLGAWAESFFAIGLFAAGLTSSITAPIAAGYAAAGCFGWRAKLSEIRLKFVAIVVIIVGLFAAIRFGSSPQEAIMVAQVANGLLLPIVAIFLLFAVNHQKLMLSKTNHWFSNILGGLVVIATIMMAARQFNSVWQKIANLWSGG